MRLKHDNVHPEKNVDIRGAKPELVIGLIIADSVYRRVVNDDVVVTSIIDGDHMIGSLHYNGYAADLGLHNVPTGDLQIIIDMLKNSLGPQWDVIFEQNHIHIEFDPDK